MKRPRRDAIAAALIEQVCEIVEPAIERRLAVRTRLVEDVQMLRQTAALYAQIPSPAEFRNKLRRLASSLRKTRSLTLELSFAQGQLFDGPPPQPGEETALDRFCATAEHVARQADFLADHTSTDREARPWNAVGYLAKLLATNALLDFGCNPYARGGQELAERAASLLYEIVTGVANFDLTRYVIHEDRALDRVEPSILMRIPFAD